MTITEELLKARAGLETELRNLVGVPVFIIEMDAFALPCGCNGLTMNTRGLHLDDLEVFDDHILKLIDSTLGSLGIEASFLFARLIPGTAEIASLNARDLCQRCYMDFGTGEGKTPRPDIYILRSDKKHR